MTRFPTIVFTTTELLYINLLTLREANDFCFHNCTINNGSSYVQFAFFANCKHFVENKFTPGFNWPKINFKFLAFRNTVLPSSIRNNAVVMSTTRCGVCC